MNTLIKSLLAAAMLTLAIGAVAQPAYPDRPVRVTVSFTPGTAADLTARLIGQYLGEAWGKPVTVENMPGAAGNIGAAHVARAAPDGYTLLMSGDAAMTTNVTLYEKLPFDPVKDFSPISIAVLSTNLLVVNPAVPARDVQELVKLARAEPGKLSYASAGSGTSQHLGAEMLKQMAGIDMVHIPYKGLPPALTDLVGGRVQLMFANIVSALPLVRDGKLRALAVSSSKRWPQMADLPTVAESGFSGFDAVAWFGLLAPAGTPDAVIKKVHQDTVKALAQPELRARLVNAGLEVIGNSPQEFAAQIREEIVRKGKLVKFSGAKPD